MKTKGLRYYILIIVLCLLAGMWILPVYAMVVASFKTDAAMAKAAYLLPPPHIYLGNFVTALMRLSRGLINSLIIAIPATILAVAVGSWSGYFLSLSKFKYGKQLFFLIAAATFLDYVIVLIPITQFLRLIHLMNTHPGLILAYVIFNAPMATLIAATFFKVFPVEVLEAADLDGCGRWQTFSKILLPLSIPGIASVFLLIFVTIWNEFLLGLTLTQEVTLQPVIPALANLKGSQVEKFNLQMAGSCLVSLLPILVFVFLGRYFVTGLMAGSSKG